MCHLAFKELSVRKTLFIFEYTIVTFYIEQLQVPGSSQILLHFIRSRKKNHVLIIDLYSPSTELNSWNYQNMFSASFIWHKMMPSRELLHRYLWDNSNLQCEAVMLLILIVQSSAIRPGGFQDTSLLPAPPAGWWYESTSGESAR